METPKLVAFDLDGTLAASKQPLTPAMGALLAKLLERMPVAVMSGASFAQFEKQFLVGLPSSAALQNLYLFPTNAAQCFVYKDTWQEAYSRVFTPEELAEINQALTEALAEVGLAEPPAQTWGPRIENRSNGQVSFSPLGQQAPVAAKEEWNKAHNDLRKQLRLALITRLSGYNVSMGGLTTVDITHEGINKAYGIRQLMQMTGIAIKDMLYVGDALEEGGNDAVVKETEVQTYAVAGPEETAQCTERLLV